MQHFLLTGEQTFEAYATFERYVDLAACHSGLDQSIGVESEPGLR